MAGERRGDLGGEERERGRGVTGHRPHQLDELTGQPLHQVPSESLRLIEEDSAHTLTLILLPQTQLQGERELEFKKVTCRYPDLQMARVIKSGTQR